MLGSVRWTTIVGLVSLFLAGVSPTRGLESEADVLELLADLPAPFIVETVSEMDVPSTTGEPGKIFRLRSARPLEETETGVVYARLSLATWAVRDSTAAKAEVRRWLAAADSDIGLTYAWDFVTSKSSSVIHLHADCTVSEELFSRVSTRLRGKAAVEGADVEESFSCSCGGGCRSRTEPSPSTEAPPRLRHSG